MELDTFLAHSDRLAGIEERFRVVRARLWPTVHPRNVMAWVRATIEGNSARFSALHDFMRAHTVLHRA